MSNLLDRFIQIGDPVLRQPTTPGFPHTAGDEAMDHRHAIEALLIKETIEAPPGAVAIAANQLISVVDYCKHHNLLIPRVFIVMIDDEEVVGTYWNPVILKKNGALKENLECCLSINHAMYGIERFEKVILQYTDINNRIYKKVFKGFPAEIVQHEVDHLNGYTLNEKGRLINDRSY